MILLLQWRHNERDSVSNHRRIDCLLNLLFRRRSKKTPKLRVTGICEGNSPVTGEFPAQRASNTENVSIWWRHHVLPARETTQRVTPAIQATDRNLYHTLIDSVSALDDTFHDIVDIIKSVLTETTEIYNRLKLRVDFHRGTSLDAVEYIVKHDFSR